MREFGRSMDVFVIEVWDSILRLDVRVRKEEDILVFRIDGIVGWI